MYPYIPQFFYIKAEFRGVNIARTCFPDVSENIYSDGRKEDDGLYLAITKTCPCNIQRVFQL